MLLYRQQKNSNPETGKKGDQRMWRLEVIKNGECVMSEWCVEGHHLKSVMRYYIQIHPEHDYRLYNQYNELIDGWE